MQPGSRTAFQQAAAPFLLLGVALLVLALVVSL